MRHLKTITLWSCALLVCVGLSWGSLDPFQAPSSETEVVDFTDTGVGCENDCLEPEIQDEAQTAISQGRN